MQVFACLFFFVINFCLLFCFSARNKQGSTALDTLRRMHADHDTMAVLQRLQEREQWWQDVERRSLWQRLLHYLKWQMEIVVRDLGWRTVLLILLVICVVSWQVTMYLHGRSPFHSKTVHRNI